MFNFSFFFYVCYSFWFFSILKIKIDFQDNWTVFCMSKNWTEIKSWKTADTLCDENLLDKKNNNLSSFQSTKEQINRTVHHWKVL